MPYKNPEDARAHARRYRLENLERIKDYEHRYAHRSRTPLSRRVWKLKHRYGLTPEQFANMLAAQGGRCAMSDCRTDEPGGKHNQWQIDHDHNTGRIRGLLCGRCNMSLGQYEKNLLRVLAFEQYRKDAANETS